MKKNPLFLGVLALALFFGLALSGCEMSPLEEGIGTVKLINNSQNVIISYWSLEQYGKILWEERQTISPGTFTSHDMESAMSIKIYVEESDGDGWLSKKSYTVKKDKTVELKFPTDFSPE